MPHNDDHGHNCGEHAHDGDHSHTHTSNGGPSDNLFAHIDRDNVVALNSVSGGSQVIKPWDERMEELVVSLIALRAKCLRDPWPLDAQYIESDVDDQLLVPGLLGRLLFSNR